MFLQKIYKTFFILLIAAACFFLLALALLPRIASTDWGKQQVEHYISGKIKQPFQADKMHFSFWGVQEIKGIKIEEADKNLSLNLSSLTIDQSFKDLIFQGIREAHVTFSGLNVKAEDVSLNQVSGEFSLSPLLFRLKGTSSQNKVEGQFDLDIALNGLDFDEISELFYEPELFLSSSADLKASLKAENFPVLLLDSLFTYFVPNGNEGVFTALFGDRLNLELNKLKPSENDHLTLELAAISPNFSANIQAEFGADKIFTRKPSTLSLKIDQDFLDRFFQKKLAYQLDSPTTLLMHLDAFSLPFNLKTGAHDFSKLMAKGNIDFAEAFFKSKSALPNIFLQQFQGAFHAKADSDYVDIALNADALQEKEPIKIALETRLHKSFDFKKQKMPPLHLDLTHIPVAFFDAYLETDLLLKALGPFINLKAEALLKKSGVDLSLQFDSKHLSLQRARLHIHEDLTLLEPLRIEYRLNKEMAERLLPANAYLSIDSEMPILATLDFEPILNIYDFQDAWPEKFKGKAFIEQLKFGVNGSKKALLFEKLSLPLELDLKNRKVHLNFSGSTRKGHKTKESLFAGEAEFQKDHSAYSFDIFVEKQKFSGDTSNLRLIGNTDNLFTKEGGLNLYGLALNLDAKIVNLPTSFFCRTLCLNREWHQKIEVLFGNILDGDLHVAIKELDGTIQAHVKGKDGSLTLDSTVQDGILFLNHPFEAKFKVTPRLGSSIMQDVFPLLSGVLESDQLISFTVPHEGFSFPVKKFDLAGIEVPKASLSLGHVKFDNSGELAAVLSLLTPENSNQLSVWFTPLYFNMHAGNVYLERVDMLISHEFPIATWGKIYLIEDKVKMKIGMSGRALKHAFKVKDLEDDYMLQIPLIGKTSKATIDKPTATAKIGALIAQSHGGPKGLVLGTVLTLAGGALSEKRAPEPTTQPLPWEAEMKAEAAEDEIAAEKPTRKKKLRLNKVFEKEAENLLNHYLK